MTEKNQIFRCNVCGNIVEVLNPGAGQLVCCNQPMELLVARRTDVGPEKHVPVVERSGDGIRVKIGEVPHPMEENHHIQWVEVIAGNEVHRRDLSPGDRPEAEFPVDPDSEFMVRAYCNIHGLWY